MSKCRDWKKKKKTYRDRISTFQAPFHYCLVQEKMVKLSYGCEHFKTKKIEYDLSEERFEEIKNQLKFLLEVYKEK